MLSQPPACTRKNAYKRRVAGCLRQCWLAGQAVSPTQTGRLGMRNGLFCIAKRQVRQAPGAQIVAQEVGFCEKSRQHRSGIRRLSAAVAMHIGDDEAEASAMGRFCAGAQCLAPAGRMMQAVHCVWGLMPAQFVNGCRSGRQKNPRKPAHIPILMVNFAH